MSITARQYLTNLLGGKVDQAQLESMIAAAGDAANETIHQDRDYRSMEGRYKTEAQKAAEWQRWADDNWATVQTELQKAEAYDRMIAAQNGRTTNPAPSPAPSPGIDPSKVVTKEDLIAMQNDMYGRVGNLTKQVAQMVSHHVSTYKEDLDLNALEKLADERSLDLPSAYAELTRPKREAAETAAREAEITRRAEEKFRDMASRYPGVDFTPRQVTHNPLTRPASAEAVDPTTEMVNIWNSQGSSAR